MGLFDLFRKPEAAREKALVHAEAGFFAGLDDPYLAEFLRGGAETASGEPVNATIALRNTAVFRAVSLISYAIGMLPLHLYRTTAAGEKEKADDHPLYRILHRRPNAWQTAFEFRSLMQSRVLLKGNAYARILRSEDLRRGGSRIIGLVPLDPDRITVWQNADWTLSYRYTPPSGGATVYAANDILHLRGLTLDGITGLSLVKQAQEAIGLALGAERAAARLFKNGVLMGGAFKLPSGSKLSQAAYDRLKESLERRHAGSGNAHKWMILEEGWEMQQEAPTASDSQLLESRRMQIEEVARVFGTPRPLLMIDDTSWGSGIEALGRFFVQYGLMPWFEAWQQGIERSLLTEGEADTMEAKFNAGALLRGNVMDQANFFSKALGAGGSQGWMTANEARELQDLNRRPDGDKLAAPAVAAKPAEATTGVPENAA